MASKDDLLQALPIRGLRADYGTKSSRKGGATALVDLEPSAAYETVNATSAQPSRSWHHDELVPMCFENIIVGVEEELRAHFGQELPALRVVVHEVLPHLVEANEMNNRYVGRWVIHVALRRLGITPVTETYRY